METSKKLYRLPEEAMLFGVIAGLGRYLGIDASLLRVITVALTIVGAGFLIIVYIVAAIWLPVAPADTAQPADKTGDSAKKPPKVAAAKTESNTDKIKENVEVLQSEFKTSRIGRNTNNILGFGLIALGLWILLDQLLPNFFAQMWRMSWPALLIVLGIALLVKTGRNES